MSTTYKQRVALVYAAILTFNLALTAAIYWQGQRVLDTLHPLAREDMVLLWRLSDLKVAVVDEEPAFYEYYFGKDRERFLARHDRNRQAIEAGLRALDVASPGHPTVAQIERHYREILQQADSLDRALGAGPQERDVAAGLIASLSGVCAQINARVDDLAQELRRKVEARVSRAGEHAGTMVRLVVAFGIAAFGAAVLVGFYVNAYLAEVRERRRLAMFPERNPNPVLSLRFDGSVAYANPGARAMLSRLRLSEGEPDGLLPSDIGGRIAALVREQRDSDRWELEIRGRILGCRMHRLEDLDTLHVYLDDITDRRRAEQRLAYQAGHDIVTRLPNRRSFERDLQTALDNGTGAVVLLNVDRFRRVVDSLGHVAGNQLLRQIGSRLAGAAKSYPHARGTVYRFEADLFAAILENAREPASVLDFAGHVRKLLRAPFTTAGQEVFVTFSMGFARFPDHGREPAGLMKRADAALQEVRRRGGNAIECCNPESDGEALQRLTLEADLQHAAERGEVEPFFQPQLDVRSGQILGMEALARWNHPRRGLVAPSQFIPVAEESGLIVEIGAAVVRSACREAAAWRQTSGRDLGVAVNISARQFADPDLIAIVAAALRDAGLPPASLELEITESVAMHDPHTAQHTMTQLKQLGVRLSIDDFGTGYSSLAYLKRFPIDRLKIDQSFVRSMAEDPGDRAIAGAVISLGHSLGVRVVAEGVETLAQLELLAAMGCDEYQGYLASRPLPARDVMRHLQRHRPKPIVAWRPALA